MRFRPYWAKMHCIHSIFSPHLSTENFLPQCLIVPYLGLKRFDCKEGAESFLLSLLSISITFLISLLKLLVRMLGVVILWMQSVPTEYHLNLTVCKSIIWECFTFSLLELIQWPSDRKYVTHSPELLTVLGPLWLNLFAWNIS